MASAMVMAIPAITRMRFWLERNCILRSLSRRKLTDLSVGRESSPAMLLRKAEKEGVCDPCQRMMARPVLDLFRPLLLHGFPIRDSEC